MTSLEHPNKRYHPIVIEQLLFAAVSPGYAGAGFLFESHRFLRLSLDVTVSIAKVVPSEHSVVTIRLCHNRCNWKLLDAEPDRKTYPIQAAQRSSPGESFDHP